MEIAILIIFCCTLFVCSIMSMPLELPLLGGLFLFCGYALIKGNTPKTVFRMCLEGVNTTKSLLFKFVLVGMLTGLWRASGTVPVLILYASRFFSPKILLILTFYLNCLISFLTGSSFAAAATTGFICYTMACAMGISPALAGGAALSGIMFGDRWSPVSTSDLLVSSLTATKLRTNLRNTFKTSVVPFIAASVIFIIAGILTNGTGSSAISAEVFRNEFVISRIALVPAVLMLILCCTKLDVTFIFIISIVISFVISMTVQGCGFFELLRYMLLGYESKDPAAAAMINGGGVKSLLSCSILILLSSSYSGIFRRTELLSSVKAALRRFSERFSIYKTALLISLLCPVMTLSQTITIILSSQLCGELADGSDEAKYQMAVDITDSAVIIPALIPWSSTGLAFIAAIGCSPVSFLCSFYLILIPVWRLIRDKNQVFQIK